MQGHPPIFVNSEANTAGLVQYQDVYSLQLLILKTSIHNKSSSHCSSLLLTFQDVKFCLLSFMFSLSMEMFTWISQMVAFISYLQSVTLLLLVCSSFVAVSHHYLLQVFQWRPKGYSNLYTTIPSYPHCVVHTQYGFSCRGKKNQCTNA